jgi:hypothetical protein
MVAFAALSMTPLQTIAQPLAFVAESSLAKNDKGDRETGSQSPL